MISREVEEVVRARARGYPIVTITGPRQSGKTTLAKAVFPDLPYVSLEDPAERAFAQEDPRRFLARFPDGAVLDEIQRAPDLPSYLQGIVDADRRTGLFCLTGSQQLGVLAGITQSLAGRTTLIHLLPFTLSEARSAGWSPGDLDEAMWTGLYPPVHDRNLEPDAWYADYVATYVERDVRQLLNVQDLAAFQRFIRLCAGRVGGLLNLSELGSDAGIAQPTAKAWLSVLEATYIVQLVRPHHANFSKRIIRTPKLHFVDTGLACWLLGIREPEQLATHPLRGPLFESWVSAELHKTFFNAGKTPPIFFWRDRAGLEIDLVIEQGARLRPVEVKAGATMTGAHLDSLRRWLSLTGDTAEAPALVYGGEESYERESVRVRGWRDAAAIAHRDP